jgi:hypothetical protein
VLGVAVVLSFAPSAGWSESGKEAFERQAYVAAAELWRAEAGRGSAEAKFGLGLIYDLGFGVPRNPAVALRWYLEAAADGLADAQFNVGVMFDAGTGVPRDPAVAATWYARSAANGNARARYNLAMLYENGTGVPHNLGLARTWYEAASPAIGAAADRLAQLSSEDHESKGPPPQPVTGAIVGPPDEPRAELVWTAHAGGNEFQVQIARQSAGETDSEPDNDEVLISHDTRRSAVVLYIPGPVTNLFWRVGRVGDTGSVGAWSSWQELSRGPVPDDQLFAPEEAPARLTIYVNTDDQLAKSYADELSSAFSEGGVEVTVHETGRPANTTTVEYRHSSDADLAASIAGFLSVLGSDSAVQMPDSDAVPGEVTLRLVGGPSRYRGAGN